MANILTSLKAWASRIKRDAVALWFARKHPDTPFMAKLLCIITVAYALSPIDLIPDFVPILGYLDDLILLPCFIWMAVRLLPAHVLADSRVKAQAWLDDRNARPKSYTGAAVIIVLWLVIVALVWKALGD